MAVVYKSVKLESGYRPDLLAANEIIVELEAIEALCHVHEAIVLTRLPRSGYHLGLLINFNVAVLKEGIRRYIL
jgi:GxxExxY protein